LPWLYAYARDHAPGEADSTSVGSLAGQLDLSGDWDSPQTNAEIAADFGISS
jgi:hypothetical protein